MTIKTCFFRINDVLYYFDLFSTFASVGIIVGLEQHLDVGGVGEVWLVAETISLTRLTQLAILIIEPGM